MHNIEKLGTTIEKYHSAFDLVSHMQDNSAWSVFNKIQGSSSVFAKSMVGKTGTFAAVSELQQSLDAVRLSMGTASIAIEEYKRIFSPISDSIKAMNVAYTSTFERTRACDSLNIEGIITGLQIGSSAMMALSELNLSDFSEIKEALPKHDCFSDINTNGFSADIAVELYNSGEITLDDINEELTEIISEKQYSPKSEWDTQKKSVWLIALEIIGYFILFLCSPVYDYTANKALDYIGITEFWEESGIYEFVDSIFGDSGEAYDSATEKENNNNNEYECTAKNNIKQSDKACEK